MSQQDDNKTIVRRFYEEVWNQKKYDVVDELFEQDYRVQHLPPWRKPGAAGLKEFIADNHRMFPDVHSTLDWLIADGDKVAAALHAEATHEGDLRGPVGLVKATHKHVQWDGIVMFRIQNGKIAETKGVIDNMSLMQQLGAVRGPED